MAAQAARTFRARKLDAAQALSWRGSVLTLVLRTTWFGTFLTEGGEVRAKELFPREAREIARRLELLQQGELLHEERRVVEGAGPFLVTENRQLKLGSLAPPEEAAVDLASRGEEFGFTAQLRREAFMLIARAAVAKARKRDAVVVQALRAYDEVTESTNRLGERLREWYGLHFPELARLVPTDRYAALVADQGSRDALLKALGLEGLPSAGGAMQTEDLEAVRALAQSVVRLRHQRAGQAKALEALMGEVAPNLSSLVGPILGARLIESAGSLERLARLPSSTVQLLGAEKALFRHLKEGTPPPKHGVLFQHPAVHTAPPWARGKMARVLAGKASIAARVDASTGRSGVGERLLREFEARSAVVLAAGPARRRTDEAGGAERRTAQGQRRPGGRRPGRGR